MPYLKKLQIVGLVALFVLLQSGTTVPAAQVAFLPLQDLSQGHNGINFPFTRYLAERLEESGTEVLSFETTVSFMAHNRIRSPGQLETYYFNLIGEELSVPYVLLGTVIQKSEIPTLALGITLNLVRTYDGRTVWSYAGAFSRADFRRLLEIGEAKSFEDLHIILADEIMGLWPGNRLQREEERVSSGIDSIVLRPQRVAPGAEIHCSVFLRGLWRKGRAPRVFFKADDQIYAADASPDGSTFQSSWVAGEKDGRFPVTLILEWPLYGRTETFQLGTYLVDGVAPLIALDLKGESMLGDEIPIFGGEVIIVPRMLIRKPIDRWRIAFLNSDDLEVAFGKGAGELPEVFIWRGVNLFMESQEVTGVFKAVLEVWDQTGNTASATTRFELNSRLPVVTVTAEEKGEEVLVDLKSAGKVPLAFWRLELWSKEGKLLKTAEGSDLPVQIGVEIPSSEEVRDIEGTLVVQDILGNKAKRKFDNLLRPPEPEETKAIIIEEKSATKAWVEEF